MGVAEVNLQNCFSSERQYPQEKEQTGRRRATVKKKLASPHLFHSAMLAFRAFDA